MISAVATDAKAPQRCARIAPVAIGGSVATMAAVVGPFSSGSLRARRGPASRAGEFTDLWIFPVGPLLVGAVFTFPKLSR